MNKRQISGISLLALMLVNPVLARAQGSTIESGAGATSASGGQQLEDIVVTARKVAENLQDVPVAITVQTGEDLARQSARNVTDIARLSPSLDIRPGVTTPSAVFFSIRGQGQTNSAAVTDGSVGVYFDGIYIARTFGINADLLDVDNVQILKGPQGTLFGRNTAGGAVLMKTNDPDLDGISGSVTMGYGRFDRANASAVVNIPLLDDRIGVRIAGSVDRRDGYIREINSGRRMDGYDNQNARIKLLIKPADNFRLLLEADYTHNSGIQQPYRLLYANPAGTTAPLAAAVETIGASCLVAANTPTCLAQGGTLLTAAAARARSDSFALNVLPVSVSETRSFIGTAELDTGIGEVKLIVGQRNVKSDSDRDVDGSPYGLSTNGQIQDLDQFSAELQLTGKTWQDRLKYVAGLYYFDEDGSDLSISGTTPALNPNNPFNYDNRIFAKSKAAYGQLTFEVTDRFSLTGGLRYTKEDKGTQLSSLLFTASSGTYVCQLTVCPSRREDSFESTDYLVSANYEISPDMMVYAKKSTGFRSGGQNGRATGSFNAFLPYGPEKTYANEIGLKSELFDRRVRLNLSAYYNIVKGTQRSSVIVVDTRTSTVTINNGEVEIKGGELELDALLFDGFRLGGTAAYTGQDYRKFVDPATGVDRSHERLGPQPPWTFTISGTYTRDLDFAKLLLRADYIWQSDADLYADNFYTDAAGIVRNASSDAMISNVANARAIVDASTQQSVGIINAKASLTFADSFELSAYVKNLTDKRDVLGVIVFPAPFDFVTGIRREPRTWGLTASYRW
jgi:iron complex outermembrane receptor protein